MWYNLKGYLTKEDIDQVVYKSDSFHISEIDKKIKETVNKLKELEEMIKKKESRWRPSESIMRDIKYYWDGNSSIFDKETIQYLLIKELARELNERAEGDFIYYVYKHEEDSQWYVFQPGPALDYIAPMFGRGTLSDATKILNRGDVDILIKEICE